MIGGSVEDNETPLEAAIRECHEELGKNAIFDEDKFKLIMEFDEIATSDQTTKIHFYVFMYEGNLKGELTTSEEIEKFMWFSINDDVNLLSNTLKNEVVPYCINNNLIYEKKVKYFTFLFLNKFHICIFIFSNNIIYIKCIYIS